MSAYTTFPTLSGVTWPVHRRPHWRTIIAEHQSGGESRTALWQYPLWEFELAFDGLSLSQTQFPNLGSKSLQTLLGTYLLQGGELLPFLFEDPIFNAQLAGPSGTGDGVSTTFFFARVVGASAEPVSYVTGGMNVYLNGVLQTPSTAWNFAAPNQIVFVDAPAMGVVVTADSNYSFLCRFLEDTGDYEQLMINLFEMKSLKFRQVRTT